MNTPHTIAESLRKGLLARPAVLGVVYSQETLRAALTLPAAPAAPDWLELRLDAFAADPAELESNLASLAARPLLITARRADEGGLTPLSAASRQGLYGRFLPGASAIDIEAQSLQELAGVVASALEKRMVVVASFHDFAGCPPVAKMRQIAENALAAGAHVFKAAVAIKHPSDVETLFELLTMAPKIPMALMGMGALARESRPALAAAGSVLNYGYLGDSPQIDGQWPVAKLRERIDELLTAQNCSSETARQSPPAG